MVWCPQGTPFAWRNDSDQPARVLYIYAPGGVEEFFSELASSLSSFVERQNLTMRMHMRRFTRLTNGHSKKIENHIYAVALHFMFYNFAKIHETIRCTPAMEAGVSDHVWSIGEIVALADSK